MKIFKTIPAAIITALLIIASCQKDDTILYYSTSIGNIQNGIFISDQGNVLNMTNISVSKEFEGIERAVIICDMLKQDESASKEYDVRLLNWSKVLVKDAITPEQTAHGENSIQDPIFIKDAWCSGGYLNLMLQYYASYGSTQSHLVNLVYEGCEDGEYRFNFRHNSFGDIYTGSQNGFALPSGYVSFPVASIIPEEKAKITIGWKSYQTMPDGTFTTSIINRTVTFDYERNTFIQEN
ncbi:MAG: hypothetical protein J6A22_06765 [Bacteroidales bacterium]|nr:hypothetical protein [Bacteroidales bacterium]